ncbi:MAG: 50S ribosomal protein L19 [Candidatus Omnitrophica bacterium]|nr:50S ribosomal protein L19 [Candidatus Omnitrophota bacterium]
MDKRIKDIESKHMKKDVPKFSIGDTVKVHVKIVEEGTRRTQAFEGIVIGERGSGTRASFTVRRISYGEGIERTFPLHAPAVDKVEVIRRGKVKRAKLYYLRKKIGKKTAVEEKIGEPSKQKESPKAPDDVPEEATS